MLLWDGSDPATDRIVRESGKEHQTIIFVPSVAAAVDASGGLVEEGVELIELLWRVWCTTAVAEAVGNRVAVGSVTFGIEAITQAAADKAKLEAA